MNIDEMKRLCPEFADRIDYLEFEARCPQHLMLQALAEARQALEDQKDIIDAAIAWQSYWSDHIEDRAGISMRQGYLYDRVRHYRAKTTPPSVKEG